jgi:hypothetical protein
LAVKLTSAAAVAAPSIGPAVVTIAGTNVPVLALCLSACGLVLARFIAPPPLRKLTRKQELALTVLLLVILFLIVTGQFSPSGEPLEAGMSVIWGIGLGFSGLLVVEFFGARVIAMLKGFFEGSSK